jgi:ferredoxin
MNLLRLAGQLAPDDRRALDYRGEHCLRYHDKAQTCQACSDICPTGALKPGTPPAFDASACQLCLACLPVCPAGALTADDEAPALAHCAQALGVRRLELICQLNPELVRGVHGVEAAIRVRGCLAGLGSAALLLLAANGVEQIVVRDDACDGCPWQRAGAEVKAQVSEARAMLALWDEEMRLCLSGGADESWEPRPVYAADSPPVSRRDLFRRPRSAATAEGPVTGGSHPFRERLRLIHALQKLGAPRPERATAPLPLPGFATLTVAEGCTACGTCARVCPTGALSLAIDDEAYSLTFAPQACIGCGMCAHVCAPAVLAVDSQPSFAEVFDGPAVWPLQQGAVARCQRCRAPYPAASGSAFCSICDFRRKNPFGSAIPPGLQRRPATPTLREELS